MAGAVQGRCAADVDDSADHADHAELGKLRYEVADAFARLTDTHGIQVMRWVRGGPGRSGSGR